MDYYILLSRLISPIQIAICFGVVFHLSGKPWSIPIAAAAATLASVWVPNDTGYRVAFWYSLVAGTIQATAIYALLLLRDKLKKK